MVSAGVATEPRSAEAETTNAVAGRYLPALDGLRALAILGVFAYHLGYGWASGGFLGVDLFFVLSGFLITSLLVEERSGSGRLRLGAFWTRRAKRLLPALLFMLVVLSIFVAIDPGTTALSQLRGDAIATILYFANWHLLLAHQSYFTQFQAPSPLQHTWSLAIEEQFYLVWPFVILGIFGIASRRRQRYEKDGWRIPGLVITVVGCAASFVAMAVLYDSGAGVNRVYYGTDTRAFDLLAGATAAMFACSRPQPGKKARRTLHSLAPLCLVVLGFCWGLGGVTGSNGGDPRTFMFYGGFLVCAVAAAVLISDVRQLQRGLVGRLLSLRPLRWIGKISYGLYLWHWPVIVELDSQRAGLSGLSLTAVRVTATFGLATLSYYLLERPIRRVKVARLPASVKVGLAPAGMVVTAVAVLLATVPASAAPGEHVSVSPTAPGAGHLSDPKKGNRNTQTPIALPHGVPSSSDPLRLMLVGDSVMQTEAPAVEAAFDSTGEARVTNEAIPGWGLTTARNWRTEIPLQISQVHPQLVVAMWEWDDSCLVRNQSTGSCSLNPAQYRALLIQFINTVLAPGDGVSGLMFEQYPPFGVLFSETQLEQRVAAEDAWDALVSSMASVFPGRVMYLPLAGAVELGGHFTVWLPPENDPSAPKSDWVRVRMLDNTHFCPAGAARYAGALLSDMTILYHLKAPADDWSTAAWTNDPAIYNNPPGSCPDDHP